MAGAPSNSELKYRTVAFNDVPSSAEKGRTQTMSDQMMSDQTIDRLCENCGETFSAFLHEMADQNLKVLCPNCRENADCHPPQATLGEGKLPVTKPH
jgi:hypothetical protein